MKTQFTLHDDEFHALSSLVFSRFGIYLSEEKRSMVAVRLQKILQQHNLSSFGAYLKKVQSDRGGRLLVELVNHITTNYTFFYRESDHFDVFVQQALPTFARQLQKKGTQDIRVWSAGCASGEEPYTLAMLMMEYFGMDYPQWNAGVLATDISERSLTTARAGIYTTEKIASLPLVLRQKYFQPHNNQPHNNTMWRVKAPVQREVVFRHFNLMNTTFPFVRPFHVIFCRNVMIYFDQNTREALVDRFYRILEPGGYLFVGHAETLDRKKQKFNYLSPAVYQKPAH